MVTLNFVIFYIFFIFASPENFMCLACVVKKFEFRRPHLKMTPSILVALIKLFQSLSFFYFYLH